MKVLYITGMLPTERFNGTEIATSEIYNSLVRTFGDVTVAGHVRIDNEHFSPAAGFEILDRRAIEFSTASQVSKLRWMLTSAFRREPISCSKFRGSAARAKMISILSRKFDVVVIDKPQMYYVYKDVLKGERVSVIWHAIENKTYMHVSESSTGLSRVIYKRESNLSKNIEIETAELIIHAFTLSESDKESLLNLNPSLEVDVIPLTVPRPDQYLKCEQVYDVGLIGNWRWSANADGLKWFYENVIPLVNDRVRISVAGSGAEEVLPHSSRVEILGRVPSASEFVNQCKVLAVPLVSGTGVSMKIIEASGEGVPTVTTPFGPRGIDDVPDNIIVADSPEDFAKKIDLALYMNLSDREFWKSAGARWLERRSDLLDERIKRGMKYAEGAYRISL